MKKSELKKAEVEKVAKWMCFRTTGISYHMFNVLRDRQKWIDLARWHLRQMAKAKPSKTMLDCGGCGKRGGR